MAKKKAPDLTNRLDAIESRLLHLEQSSKPIFLIPILRGRGFRHPGFIAQASTAPHPLRDAALSRNGAHEAAVEPWKHLVQRAHPWRKQLSLRGCNLTARQLAGSIKANQFDEATAAANYNLPVEAIREALVYVEKNKELLETEAEIERLMLRRGGVARGPQLVS